MFTREKLKQELLDNKSFHYQLTDKDRQSVEYDIRYNNKTQAKTDLKELIWLMDLWKDSEVPEWFTRKDLKKLIQQVETM